MGNLKYRQIILLSLLIGIMFASCKDKWEDHNKIQDPALSENLLLVIQKNPDLSTFAGYLKATGYDEVLTSSKTFTVWAPSNLALQNLDQSIVTDPVKLKQFVGNHISNQNYLTRNANPVLTIRTLNGKNILFTKTTFEEANILAADQYSGNGVLHIIDLAIIPKLNAWEYLNNSATSLQKSFLLSQNYIYRNLFLAEVTGIDPKTGNPIYKEGTGYFPGNYFLNRTSDIANEDGKYTFVILTDAAFATEKAKMLKYFNIIDPAKTPARNAFLADSLTNWYIVKDLVLKGDYTINNLPDTLTSYDSLKIHLDRSAIVETHKVSNGVVYVMNRIDYKMSGKIKPVIIEGESYVPYTGVTPAVSYTNTTGSRSTNTRMNPITNKVFIEIYFRDHGTASFWIHYLPTVNAVTYKVYWVAVRDYPTVLPLVMFSQRVTFANRTLVTLPYKQVEILNYNEVYLGDYTTTSYGALDTFLVSAASTVNGENSLILDYIKMVPVIN